MIDEREMKISNEGTKELRGKKEKSVEEEQDAK